MRPPQAFGLPDIIHLDARPTNYKFAIGWSLYQIEEEFLLHSLEVLLNRNKFIFYNYVQILWTMVINDLTVFIIFFLFFIFFSPLFFSPLFLSPLPFSSFFFDISFFLF
jgi:hypothetical protein